MEAREHVCPEFSVGVVSVEVVSVEAVGEGLPGRRQRVVEGGLEVVRDVGLDLFPDAMLWLGVDVAGEIRIARPRRPPRPEAVR